MRHENVQLGAFGDILDLSLHVIIMKNKDSKTSCLYRASVWKKLS